MKNTMKRLFSLLLSFVLLLSLVSGINFGGMTKALAAEQDVEEIVAEQNTEDSSEQPWFYLSDFPPMEKVVTGWTTGANYLSINSSIYNTASDSADAGNLYLCTEKATNADNAVKFEKGMSIHANGKITYDISDMKASRFTCLFGPNPKQKAGLGSVGLLIYTDLNAAGEYLYCLNSAADAERLGVEKFPVGQYDKAVEVDIAIPEGATRLYIEVTNGGNGGSNDIGVFAEPKLYAEFEYLSNLEYESASTGWGNVLVDKAFNGPIILNTLYQGSANGPSSKKAVTYDNGITAHAASSVTYNIEGLGVKRFTSFCGISTNNGSYDPNTTFKVFFDDVEVYTSTKKKSAANVAIDGNVDLQVPEGTKTITLTTKVASGANSGNHTSWACPRLFVESLDQVNDVSLAVEHGGMYLNVAQEVTVTGKSLRGERELKAEEVRLTAESDNITVDGNKVTATSGETALLKVECLENGNVVFSKTFELDILGEHTHVYEAVVTAPTCTAGGYTTRICTICDEVTVGDYVDAVPHSFDEATGVCIYGCGTNANDSVGIYKDGMLVATYSDINEAIAAYESGTIKLYQDSDKVANISSEIIIDLAGYSLSNVTVSEGTLKLIDSAASYEGAIGSATVTGTVEAFTEANGKTYLVVGDNGVYTAHPYDVELTHVSLKPANDALGYKAKLYGDAIVQEKANNFGFNMWVDGGQIKTYGKTGSDVLTLRLQNILAAKGGEININATAFVTLAVGEETYTKTCTQQTTTMKQTLQAVNAAWDTFSADQRAAVKALCYAYYDTVYAWNLKNILPIDEYGRVDYNYETVTGAIKVYTDNGFTVNGKLVPPASGEGKVILQNTPAGNKTVSVELYPNDTVSSAVYLGVTNVTSTQNYINALNVLVESTNTSDPNRIDIVFGSFPDSTPLHRVIIDGDNALYSDGNKEPLKLEVAVEGNELTVTLSLISDPSKSFTTTYSYAGEYDLTSGQVGLRSRMSDCAFDNFQVNDTIYTFDDEDSVKAMSFYHSTTVTGIQTTAANTLALHNAASFTEGTLTGTVNTAGKNAGGLVFGADATGQNYHIFRIKGNNNIELVKVENGVETVLELSYLTASHDYAKDYRLEIVKNGNIVYCYYYTRYAKTNCYVVEEVELAGDRIGVWSDVSGAVFNDLMITDATENRTAETLIFGHSYTEMWWNSETYFPEYTDIENIGIGGASTLTWERLAKEVISYQPKLGIYNIGINDLSRGYEVATIVDTIESTLLSIKEALPEFRVVLLSVNHCPARTAYIDGISETNVLMRAMAAKYDWVWYVDVEYLFCSDPTDPTSTIASYFGDGLHPTSAGYKLLTDAIRNVINNPNTEDNLADTEYEAITGAYTANSLNGFTVDGKLTPDASGEGKVILRDTPADVKTVSVELHPNGSIASGIYLSAF